MRIVMVGSGYVGLVSGTCLADVGHSVICVDKVQAKVDKLKAGGVPIYEPGLSELVTKNVKAGRLSFTTDLKTAATDADAVFIAVGTPSRKADGFADLSYVYGAAREIAESLKRYTVVVTKSTVPVGTGDEIERIIREAQPKLKFSVVSNPEFLREGAAIDDFMKPDRIVVGANDTQAKDVMSEIYAPLVSATAPLIFTDRRTSELTKYAANAFLMTKIMFINEIADLCEAVGGNVQEVARGIGLDQRIGARFLNAGPGYGGSCFPKDTQAIIKTAQDHDVALSLVEAGANANEKRKRAMGRKVISACGGNVRGKTIAILGLTFKPDTDDMRDAPSINIIQTLQDNGARIRAYDPKGEEQARPMLNDIEYAEDPYSCLKGADAVCLITEWAEFKSLDLNRVKSLLKSPIVIDLRNVFSFDQMEKLGFNYHSVGRPSIITIDRKLSQTG